MITIATAENYLKNKIGDNTNDVLKVWEEFKAFAKEDVVGEEEKAILFQCGIFNFTGEKLFYFDLVRQFTDIEDGNMQQLHCEFVFNPVKEFKKLKVSEWYFNYEGELDDYFKKVENLKEFKIPLNYTPVQFNIFQEEV
ncbi:hypothetical protein [Heyndrickxia camelliae]|uniref:Uncharacterized protein n=1 Tax=Heyndrickxia camelliae TaxID=1707093 RepID=A0A2N3LND6_9BACI|nr:hypothetical protein [Heyndrickxia camelliae]PKR86077.1 hypothetical protein CWO92_06815 [Heyndrickxia camelliae]